MHHPYAKYEQVLKVIVLMQSLNFMFVGYVWSIIIMGYIIRSQYRASTNSLNFSIFNLKYSSHLIFLTIGVVALLVRIFEFGDIPAGINQDEAMAAVDARSLLDYGTDRFGNIYPVLFQAWGFTPMSVMLSYLMLPFIKIGGFNELTVRLPALFLSLIGLLALYGFVRNVCNQKIALFAFFIASINPWHIMQSRWSIDCNIYPHFFIIGCYFLSLSHYKLRYLYISTCVFSLCLYSYSVAILAVPLFLFIALSAFAYFRIVSIRHATISYLVFILLSTPILLVMIVNLFHLPTIDLGFATLPNLPGNTRQADILFFNPDIKRQILLNIEALLNTAFIQGRDLLWNSIDEFGTQYLFSLPLVLVGIGSVASKLADLKQQGRQITQHSNEKLSEYSGAIILSSGLIISIWTGLVISSVNVNRINIVYYFLILFAVFGIIEIRTYFKQSFYFIAVIYSASFLMFGYTYFGVWSQKISYAFFNGLGIALKQAAELDTPRYYITVNSQYAGSKNVSEIYLLFYHKVDAQYFQGHHFDKGNLKKSSDTISGNKYELDYADRYVFINPANFRLDPNEKAVYVINQYDAKFFDPVKFNVTINQGFGVVTPKPFF